ncbi:MAG: S8 family serine peptidase [Acidobacteriota bacterium]
MKPGTYSLKLAGILILTASSLLALAVGMIAVNWSRPAVASMQQPISGNALQQIQALLDEKASRSVAERKIDSQLIYAAKVRRGQNIAIGVPTLEINVAVDAQGRTIVDITALPGKTLLEDLAKRGAKVISAFPQYRSYRVNLALDQLEAVAALPEVQFIQPKQEAAYSRRPGAQISPSLAAWHQLLAPNFAVRAGHVRAALSEFLFGAQQPQPLSPATGSVTSQGDTTHRAGTARTTFGVNGAGVRIGVISNGVNNLAASLGTGDLPATVTILTGQAGSGDEGTAMLEIIYDLAPGAQLFFATANNSLASFAQNIRDLQAAGCQIIVDDVGYFAETPLQDGQTPGVVATTNGGLIAQAVNDVTAAGVLYFSSAGNSGNKNDNTSGVWEGDFADGGANALLPGGTVHNFGGGVLFDTITVGTSNPGTLFWSDPLGASANDYDLFVLNSTGTSVVTSSTNPQTGTQDPFEIVGSITANNRLVILKKTGAANRFLHLNTNRGRLSLSTAGQTHGHSCSANAYGVAATPAATAIGAPPNPTGPFPNPFNSANTVELFSSDGPRRILYNADSTAITPGNVSATGGLLRQKPDITAADGVAVTGVGGFGSPFFGTSAAAPHAAAIAALLKSAKPAFTSAQIRAALTSTAIDIETAGVDRDAGAGIIMAFEALQSIGAAASPTLTGAGSSLTTESCPAANSAIDPGETVMVNLSLKNEGNANTANLTATLQATGGVTLPGGAQNYGVVVAGGAIITRPFTFTADAALACGGLLTATLQLQDGPLNLGTASFNFRLGAIASTTATTYSYGGPPVALPDLNAVEIPITVPDAGLVSDVNVRVRLNHTWDADLSILLISPDGTLVDLSTGNGSNGDNYGSGANNCTGTFTVFDDAAATSIISSSAPFAGTFRPAGRLTGFNGKAVNGVWKLRILDVAAGDTGTLGCWQIEITRQLFTCCSGGLACPTVASINPTLGVAGSSVTITGTNFSGVTAVKFSNNVTATITNNTGTQLTVTVPAGAVTGPLTISKTGCADVATASFTVCSTLTVNPTTLPDGTGGAAYSQTITASGGTAPYNFTVTAGALPGGLALASGGLLSGTPSFTGTFNFTVTATDANGCTGARNYTVSIAAPQLDAQSRALYVLNDCNGCGNQVYGYAAHETTGALTLLSGFPVATGGNGSGCATCDQLTIDRTNNRLYAINRGSNTISAYAINTATGALTPLPFNPINLGSLIPNNVAVHPSGSPLVIGGQLTILASYQITATTATAAAGSPYSAGSAGPFSAAFSQNGNYVYTGGNVSETFAGFSVNPATGVLSALAGSPFSSGASGSDSPEGFATDVSGRLFMANFFSAQVRAFTTANGLPIPVSGNPFASSLTRAVNSILHPNGFYLIADYLGNRVGVHQISGSGSATTVNAVSGSPFASGGITVDALALN